MTDCGRILSNLLLNQGFVDKISLLIHPIIVGKGSYDIFNDVNGKIQLKLINNDILDEGYIWIVYDVIKS
jgi:2,5-diamino-6-(ribosylamino)-4(3H)-pyrimidinone 5'-phosphate reductase